MLVKLITMFLNTLLFKQSHHFEGLQATCLGHLFQDPHFLLQFEDFDYLDGPQAAL
jgi:hypothetical protein